MSEKFQKRSSHIFVSIFIGFIVISFIFTGYQSMQGTPDSAAKVNGRNIRIREFENAYRSTLEFYRNIFGGRSLTNRQIEQMNVGPRVIDDLIQKKLLFEIAEGMGFSPGPEEVREFIKKQEYFLTNDTFDIGRYKALLRANGLTPEEYENSQTEDIAVAKIRTLLDEYPLSSRYMEDIRKFKGDIRQMSLVSIDKRALTKFIAVPNQEIDSYLEEETNVQRVAALFNDRVESLSEQEQIEASHILLRTTPSTEKEVLEKITDIRSRLTPRNFASEAGKHTEDPSGKQNGGSLGKFARGRMVKEFDDVAFSLKKGDISPPVKTNFGYHIIHVTNRWEARTAKIEEHQRDIAKELIQRTKPEEEKSSSRPSRTGSSKISS